MWIRCPHSGTVSFRLGSVKREEERLIIIKRFVLMEHLLVNTCKVNIVHSFVADKTNIVPIFVLEQYAACRAMILL